MAEPARLALPFAGVFRQRQFRQYFAGYFFFVVAKSLQTVVAPLIVLDQTGSARLTALAATINWFPFLVFGVIAGAVTDHLNKQAIMVGAGALGCAVSLLPFAFSADSWIVPMVFVSRLAVGIADVWHTMCHFGTLPFLVERHELAEATSALQSATQVVSLVAPLSAVYVLHLWGPGPVFVVTSAIFGIGALLRLRADEDNGGLPTSSVGTAFRRVVPDVTDGFRITFGNPMLRLLTVTGLLGSTAYGAVNALMAVYLFTEFDIAADDPVQGYFLTAGAVGVLSLVWLLPVIRRRSRPVQAVGILQTGVMTAAIGLAASHHLWISLILFALLNGWGSMMFTNIQSLRMEMLPLGLQGRVGSASKLIAAAGTPLGGILGGLAVAVLPIRDLFLATTVVWAASFALLWSHRHLRDAGLLNREAAI